MKASSPPQAAKLAATATDNPVSTKIDPIPLVPVRRIAVLQRPGYPKDSRNATRGRSKGEPAAEPTAAVYSALVTDGDETRPCVVRRAMRGLWRSSWLSFSLSCGAAPAAEPPACRGCLCVDPSWSCDASTEVDDEGHAVGLSPEAGFFEI